MHARETEEEELKQQQRLKTMTDTIRKIKAKGRVDANNSWWVSEVLAADCTKCGSTQNGGTHCSSGTTAA